MLGGALIYNKEGVAVTITRSIGTVPVPIVTTTEKSLGGQTDGKPNPVIFIVPPRVEPTNEFVVSEKLRFKGNELVYPTGSSRTLTK